MDRLHPLAHQPDTPHVQPDRCPRPLVLEAALGSFSKTSSAFSAALRLVYLISRNELRKVLQVHRPHLIISVHPFMQHIFLAFT